MSNTIELNFQDTGSRKPASPALEVTLITASIDRAQYKSTMKQRRRSFSADLQQRTGLVEENIAAFNSYFEANGYNCPLPAQYSRCRESGLQSGSLLIDSLLYCEMLTGYLMGLQDASKIVGPDLRFVCATGSEVMTGYDGPASCKVGDPLLIDAEGVVASLFMGPDLRTNVDSSTADLAFFIFDAPNLGNERRCAAVEFVMTFLKQCGSSPVETLGYLVPALP